MSKDLYLPKLKEVRKHLRKKMTDAEKYLWHFLRRKQLGYKFLRQVSIGYFVVDFYCKELALAIEVDGAVHNKKNILDRDKIRQEIIETDNIKFLRFTNDEVFNNTKSVILKIQHTCSILSNNP